MKLRQPEAEGNDQRAPRGGRDLVEMHDAEDAGENGAGDDPEQHRDVGKETRTPPDQAEDEQQHESGDAEPLQLAIGGIGERAGHAVDDLGQRRQSAAGPVDADAHQGNADHQDDGAGHDRRKQRQQAADERRGNYAEDSGSDDRAVDAEQPDVGRSRHRQHRPDGGKGDAHHHGQPDTDAAKAEALHQRGKPAGEQIGADQVGHVLRRQLQRPADDEGHGDRAGIHDQHMLQPERQQTRNRQDFVDWMDFGAHGRPFWSGEIPAALTALQ